MKKSFSAEIEFCKSEMREEQDWWVVRGIASDESIEDLHGEVVMVDGIDTSRVGVSSMFKYEHSDNDPGVFLGPIDKAYKENGKLILEGRLLKSLPAAVKVATLMGALSKVGRKMRLSIEGKRVVRDKVNKKIIRGCLLTNCSFTLMPINRGTEVEIIKSENTNGGNIDCLVDIFNEETGERVTVDKNYKIKIEKTLKKTMALEENLSAIQKEDVENGKPKIFTKSETYNYILENFTTDIKKSKEIYSIIKETQQILNQDMENISEEAILKAKELLNIAKSESGDKIAKSESKSADELEYESLIKKAEEVKSRIGKTDTDEEEEEEGEDKKTEKEIKASEKDKDKKEPEEEAKKSENSIDEMFKSELFNKIESLGTLIESKDGAIEDLKKSLNTVKKINEALSVRLKLVEETPIDRKVQTNTYVDRFEKSENGSEGGYSEVYSLRNDREALLDRMYDLSNLKKGENVDHLMVKGFQNLECTKMFSSNPVETQKIIDKLASYGVGLKE